MKFILFSTLLLGLSASGMALDRAARVPCVGGPRKPSYAFSHWRAAEICRRHVARASHSCARMVRMRHCYAHPATVNAVAPQACVCNPGGVGVGNW
jgi:hypothetical protein